MVSAPMFRNVYENWLPKKRDKGIQMLSESVRTLDTIRQCPGEWRERECREYLTEQQYAIIFLGMI